MRHQLDAEIIARFSTATGGRRLSLAKIEMFSRLESDQCWGLTCELQNGHSCCGRFARDIFAQFVASLAAHAVPEWRPSRSLARKSARSCLKSVVAAGAILEAMG